MPNSKNENDKPQILVTCLEHGLTMIHLDARPADVIIPNHLKHEHHLKLNLSHKFPQANISIDDHALEAQLSFGGDSMLCYIPFQYVFGITSFTQERFYLFAHSIPQAAKEEWESMLEQELVNSATDEEPEEENSDSLELLHTPFTVVEGEKEDDIELTDSAPINKSGAPVFRIIDGGKTADTV